MGKRKKNAEERKIEKENGMRLGTTELLIIMGIAILIFGPKKLPQLGKAMGQTIGNFKRSSKRAEDETFPAAEEQAES